MNEEKGNKEEQKFQGWETNYLEILFLSFSFSFYFSSLTYVKDDLHVEEKRHFEMVCDQF